MPNQPEDEFNLSKAIEEIKQEQRPSTDAQDIIELMAKFIEGSMSMSLSTCMGHTEAPKTLKSGFKSDEEVMPKSPQDSYVPYSKGIQKFSSLLKEEKIYPSLNLETLKMETFDKETDMIWKPKGGPEMLTSQMETRHLFFALRMLFNKAVAPQYRLIGPGTLKTDWPKVQVKDEETKRAIKILFYRLSKRDNISEAHLEDLKYMAKIAREHL